MFIGPVFVELQLIAKATVIIEVRIEF